MNLLTPILAPFRSSLFVIFRYDLLMQIKSIRFKAMCALAILVAVAQYFHSYKMQEHRISENILNFELMLFYLIAICFTGIHSVGRIHSTGVSPILMIRPFHTSTLMLSQALSALVSLLVPMTILMFPVGMILKWQCDIEFSALVALYLTLFYVIPSICCLVTLSQWIRTCFKSVIPTLIVLGIVCFPLIWMANSRVLLIQSAPGVGPKVIFLPLVTCFSFFYWSGVSSIEDSAQITFMDGAAWSNFGLSMVCCMILIMLSCYHLRRTEPQRKVLKRYGSRWYHTPTIVKLMFDLRIDPHVTWKSHLTLVCLISLIVVKAFWPVVAPHYQNWKMTRGMNLTEENKTDSPYHPLAVESISIEEILKVRIRRDKQNINPDRFHSELEVWLSPPGKARYAIIQQNRWLYSLNKISLNQKDIPFRIYGRHCFISVEDLDIDTSGTMATLTLDATKNSAALGASSGGEVVSLSLRGYEFVNKISTYEGPPKKNYYRVDGTMPRYPVQLRYAAVNNKLECIQQPVNPEIKVDQGMKCFIFDVPIERSGSYSSILLASPFIYHKATLHVDGLDIQFIVAYKYKDFADQWMEVMAPVFQDYARLHLISSDYPIAFQLYQDWHFRYISQQQKILRYRSFHEWEQRNFMQQIQQLELETLKAFLASWWNDNARHNQFPHGTFDLKKFLEQNINRGLNARAAQSSYAPYQPPEYISAYGRIGDIRIADKMRFMSRKELIEKMPQQLPLFQMLYLYMGHDDWQRMLIRLHQRIQTTNCSPEIIEACVEEIEGDALRDFFDYWLYNGEDYPMYIVEQAEATLIDAEGDDLPRYELVARLRNAGTGNFRTPVQLELSNNETIEEMIQLPSGETVVWEKIVKSKPRNIYVDQHGWLLSMPFWNEETHRYEYGRYKKGNITVSSKKESM